MKCHSSSPRRSARTGLSEWTSLTAVTGTRAGCPRNRGRPTSSRSWTVKAGGPGPHVAATPYLQQQRGWSAPPACHAPSAHSPAGRTRQVGIHLVIARCVWAPQRRLLQTDPIRSLEKRAQAGQADGIPGEWTASNARFIPRQEMHSARMSETAISPPHLEQARAGPPRCAGRGNMETASGDQEQTGTDTGSNSDRRRSSQRQRADKLPKLKKWTVNWGKISALSAASCTSGENC